MDNLIQRARCGDADAFAQLFERSKQPLWRAAMAVLGNVDDAADALQEAAVKAWCAMPRFGGRSSVETWFMRIVLRTCFDVRLKRGREVPFDLGVLQPETPGDAVSLQGAIDECRAMIGGARVVDRDESLDVRAAVARLSADDRLILALFYVNDFPMRRIASILDISEGAARTRLARARSRFKAEYLRVEEIGGDDAERGSAIAQDPTGEHGSTLKQHTRISEVAQ